jgi:transposase-like protein
MARKSYSEEFRRQAVDLYECTPGATLRGIAADLGIVRGTQVRFSQGPQHQGFQGHAAILVAADEAGPPVAL